MFDPKAIEKDGGKKWRNQSIVEFTSSFSGGIVFELKTLPHQKPNMFAWNSLINLLLQ